MRLSQALRLPDQPRLAVVGAGGKTTALFRLARELSGAADPVNRSPVLVSTTTHLARLQASLADYYYEIQVSTHLNQVFTNLPQGVILLSGGDTPEERLAGPAPDLLEALGRFSDQYGLPLLLEADGARQLPLKAPGAHEPAIPAWLKQVVVVVGLSGLGAPLGPEYVHRPEIFSALSGLQPGEPISLEAIGRVLCHPQGGLKGIPAGVRPVALLNQVDTPERLAAAQHLAQDLLGAYDRVLAASLRPGGGDPVQEEDEVLAVYERTAGVILAAGASTRFGQAKLVLPWRDEPLVRHVARAALQAGLDPVIVVTGAEQEALQQALQGMPVVFVHNPDWQSGQGRSVGVGLSALPDTCGAAIFLLADQPRTPPELIRMLRAEHAVTLAPIIAPLIDGQRGNPVLFDRVTFPDLSALQGNQGGRAIFGRYAVRWLPWLEAQASQDIDTPEDYARLLAEE